MHIHIYIYIHIYSRVARRTIYTFISIQSIIRIEMQSYRQSSSRMKRVYSATGDRWVYMYICMFVCVPQGQFQLPRPNSSFPRQGLYMAFTRALHGRWSRELNRREFTRVCALGLYLLMVWGSTRALHGLYTVDGLGSSILVNSRGFVLWGFICWWSRALHGLYTGSLDHRPCRARLYTGIASAFRAVLYVNLHIKCPSKSQNSLTKTYKNSHQVQKLNAFC